MITERQEELAALYVLGLLEGAELRAFEAELAGNRELEAFVTGLGGTAASLALTAPDVAPPPELRQRVLDAAAAEEPARSEAFAPMRFVPWGIAAALALVSGVLGYRNAELREKNEVLQTERRQAEEVFRAAREGLFERSLMAEKLVAELGERLRRSEDLARLKVAALASLAGNTKEAQAIAVWDPEQQAGLLTFDKMPVIGDKQDYQIWVVDPAYPNPVNGGVFKVDEEGRATLAFKPDQPVRAAAAFAISLEKKGGVPKAEGPIVLLGKLRTM
jgi:anti-sigma-K factor RskA